MLPDSHSAYGLLRSRNPTLKLLALPLNNGKNFGKKNSFHLTLTSAINIESLGYLNDKLLNILDSFNACTNSP